MADKQPQPKIGAGSLSAWIRTGWREIRAALYPESNVAQQPDVGMWGNRTPGEVMQERSGETRDPDERPAILDKYFKQPEADRESNAREPEPREPERD